MLSNFWSSIYLGDTFPFKSFVELSESLVTSTDWQAFIQTAQISQEQTNQFIPAFVHPSFVHERKNWSLENNQRLEFLGDAILDAILVDYLVKTFPNLNEGALSKLKVSLVNEALLAELANYLKLSQVLILGKGEFLQNGYRKPSVLADALEAFVGQYFLLNGYGPTAYWVIKLYLDFEKKQNKVLFSVDESLTFDSKGRLQEELLRISSETPVYIESEVQNGFVSRVEWMGLVLGEAIGANKKAAQKNAAQNALIEKKFLERVINNK